jgi:uncharacterized heparinase superfamily protein
MTAHDLFRKVSRSIAFGRRVSLAKLARRIELNVKRGVMQRTGGRAPRCSVMPDISNRLPKPLFKPREGKLECDAGGLRFTFLHCAHQMTGAVDWGARGEGAENQLWRMNLHYMEYLEELDDGPFLDLVAQWIAANRPYERGYWKDSWNSYAVSLRTVVWMQQLAFRRARLDSAARAAMLASLVEQIRFLEANLETDIGGNHLLKNIKALVLASVLFTGREADRWRSLSLRMLAEEIPRQVFSDGFHYERSPSYHCQTFADLLECRHALGEDPLGGALDRALSGMAQAVADLTHPDGRVALFNDAGLSMAYTPGECLDVYERIFFSRPPGRSVFAFDNAGYYGARSDGAYFVADCGRIAPDDLPAHGHGDVLSFEWSVGAERIIVDPGVFEYIECARRQGSRSAANHNTLCFEGADQAEFFGAFRCGRRPNVELLSYEPRSDGFSLEGAHDGFSNLPGAPRHIRRFDVGPGEIVIRDRIERADRPASIGFLLHPAVEAQTDGCTARLRRGATVVEMTTTRTIRNNPAVWWPDMGREEPTRRLSIPFDSGACEATTAFRTARTQ